MQNIVDNKQYCTKTSRRWVSRQFKNSTTKAGMGGTERHGTTGTFLHTNHAYFTIKCTETHWATEACLLYTYYANFTIKRTENDISFVLD